MMNFKNLTQMERNALCAFGVPGKKDTNYRLWRVADIAMKRDVKEMLWDLVDKLTDSAVTEECYQQMFYTARHYKELVLIRTTVVYQEMFHNTDTNRPWSSLAKVLLTSIFGDVSIRITIQQLAKLRRYTTDEQFNAVLKEMEDELFDMEYLCPNIFPTYLEVCREFDMTHGFKSDEEILSHYKDGGYTGELA